MEFRDLLNIQNHYVNRNWVVTHPIGENMWGSSEQLSVQVYFSGSICELAYWLTMSNLYVCYTYLVKLKIKFFIG